MCPSSSSGINPLLVILSTLLKEITAAKNDFQQLKDNSMDQLLKPLLESTSASTFDVTDRNSS